MNCTQLESRLMEYVDGTLGSRDREAAENHARNCSLCAERIDRFSRGFPEVFSLLDSWNGIEPSPSFNARLRERLEKEVRQPAWWSSRIGRLLPLPLGNPVLAGALLVVISLAALVIKSSPSETQIATSQAQQPYVAAVATGVDDLDLYQDMPVLEDLDVLRNFEVLGELSVPNSIKK
jgi:anti-sigma factor RsiW